MHRNDMDQPHLCHPIVIAIICCIEAHIRSIYRGINTITNIHICAHYITKLSLNVPL